MSDYTVRINGLQPRHVQAEGAVEALRRHLEVQDGLAPGERTALVIVVEPADPDCRLVRVDLLRQAHAVLQRFDATKGVARELLDAIGEEARRDVQGG